jgi:hypothetical protein
LKDFDWLLFVRYSRRILFLASSINTHCYCLGHVQFGVAAKFELLDSIHQDLRSRIILRYHCNVIHEGFLAFGNGCADLFSMLAATLSGPGGMELAVGEGWGTACLSSAACRA